MEWEELFSNGIYSFAGEPLPIDPEKCVNLICEKDSLDACLNLNFEITYDRLGFLCGKYEAKKIYKHFKEKLENLGENAFIEYVQYYYHGLIVKNDSNLIGRFKKKFINRYEGLYHIRILFYAFKEKNYDLLKELIKLCSHEKTCIALVDNGKIDIELYEFTLKYVCPELLTQIIINAAYEINISTYKPYLSFLKPKLSPLQLENMNRLCFNFFGVALDYF